MKTGFSLLEILHRENTVFITGMGLQCSLTFWDKKSEWKKCRTEDTEHVNY